MLPITAYTNSNGYCIKKMAFKDFDVQQYIHIFDSDLFLYT